MTMANRIHDKLTQAFQPSQLEILDESARHAGHSGARPEGETHFQVRITADAFTGLPRLERQRRIYAALDDEMKSIHALAIVARAPNQPF
jgi:BolA protein